jgi:aspartate/methionine/tyrosine aminotransferase
MPHRSRRIPRDLSLNRLAEARIRIGEVPYDLTLSNPTVCGFPYPPDLLTSLGDPRGLVYDPEPRGPMAARRAVAAGYRQWGAEPSSDRIVLTASTSEAYGFLFRLLCDPGDAVLVPSPSYPLFDHLARLDGIEARTYALDAEDGWRFDFSSIDIDHPRVRAVVVVHPNNPTGSYVHPEDRKRLVRLCREREWVLIADEVFLPYPLEGGPGDRASFATVTDCLCCTLGGISKSLGLPQLKLGWIVGSGPNELVEPFLDGFDFVADAALSVSAPVALAAPELLSAAGQVRDAIGDRCRSNLSGLRGLAAPHSALTLPLVGGGWSAVLRVPSVVNEESLCLELLERHGVAVYPGHFFGFSRGSWLVLSLLPEPEIFAEGVRRMFGFLSETIRPRRG